MPFVPVPKDLSKIKNRPLLNLTARQLLCFGSAAAVGVPTYIFTRGVIGNEGAVLLMIGLMLPFFFMAMYEKDNQPAEKVILHYIRARLYFPRRRPYKTENLYAIIKKEFFPENIPYEEADKTIENNKADTKKSSKHRKKSEKTQ